MHRRPQFEPLARLAAAGCGLSGPWGPRWVGLSCRARLPGPLVLRWVRNPAGCCCGGFAAGACLGGCAPGFGPGALPSSRVGAYIRLGAAAAALPPGRVWVAVPLEFGLGAWPSSRVGAFALPGAAAAALPPGRVWVAVPLGLGRVLGPVIGVDALRIRRTLMSAFPLKNNRPLSEGAAGYSRLGEGRCTHRSRLLGLPHGKSAPRSL